MGQVLCQVTAKFSVGFRCQLAVVSFPKLAYNNPLSQKQQPSFLRICNHLHGIISKIKQKTLKSQYTKNPFLFRKGVKVFGSRYSGKPRAIGSASIYGLFTQGFFQICIQSI